MFNILQAYGSTTCKTLKTLDPIHHKGMRLALEAFTICKTENILIEAEMGDINTA
jgi:hypothetical protein